MDKRIKTLKILAIINAILIVTCVIGCIINIANHYDAYYVIASITELIALAFSLLYYSDGFKKDASKYYRLFMLFYAFTYIIEIIAVQFSYADDLEAIIPHAIINIIISMILYGNTLLLAVAKDLGKTTSYILCGINVVFYIIPLIGGFIITKGQSADLILSETILNVVWFILACNAMIMCMAKYNDKALRALNKKDE